MGKIKASGVPQRSDEEMLATAKILIGKSVDEAVWLAYSTTIMGVGDIEDLNQHILECLVESKNRYRGMTKGQVIAKISDEYEEL